MSGDYTAQEKLAWIYDNGSGVRKSYKKAFYWYLKASKNGNPIVHYNLGLCYLLGKGVSKNAEKAFYWTQLSAEAGYNDAMLALGWHYLNGYGVTQNFVHAKKWYNAALIQEESGEASFSLGQIAYDEGRYEAAKYYFVLARDKFNHPRSYYYLGRMYFEENGVERNLRTAKKYLLKASSSGICNATRLLNSKRFKKMFNR